MSESIDQKWHIVGNGGAGNRCIRPGGRTRNSRYWRSGGDESTDEARHYQIHGQHWRHQFQQKNKQSRAPGLEGGVEENRYKTELCRSFRETGVCRYGNKCRFAHGIGELRPRIQPILYKTEKCQNHPNCKYGPRCRFIHDETPQELEALRARAYSARSDDSDPVPKSESIQPVVATIETVVEARKGAEETNSGDTQEQEGVVESLGPQEEAEALRSMTEDVFSALDRVTCETVHELESDCDEHDRNDDNDEGGGGDDSHSDRSRSSSTSSSCSDTSGSVVCAEDVITRTNEPTPEYMAHMRRLEIFGALTTLVEAPSPPAVPLRSRTLVPYRPLVLGCHVGRSSPTSVI